MIIDRLLLAPAFSKKAVCVVAHADDEALWFGGLISNTHFEWTVICCSIPESDPVRAWKFYNACTALGAIGRVIPIQESRLGQPIQQVALDLVDLEDYDLIATHGAAGAYGHNQHIQLGGFVAQQYPDKTVRECYGMDEGEYVIDLDGEAWDRKQTAIKAYDHFDAANGGSTPKWQVLLDSFTEARGFNLRRETYSGPA